MTTDAARYQWVLVLMDVIQTESDVGLVTTSFCLTRRNQSWADPPSLVSCQLLLATYGPTPVILTPTLLQTLVISSLYDPEADHKDIKSPYLF